MEYEIRTLSYIVSPIGYRIFSEMATTVTITDEGAGEYIEVSQSGRDKGGKIFIEPKEWDAIKEAIDTLILGCRKEDA